MPESISTEATNWLAAGWLESPSALVQIALGAVLLLFGRRLFWLLVGVVGFALGLLLADTYLPVDAETMRWIVALGAGLVAAFAAVFLQKVALGLAGGVIGGYSAFWYLSLSGESLVYWQWALVLGAAVVGFMVARAVFDFGLILLSSLAGATLVAEHAVLEGAPSRWVFVGLVVLGGAVQMASMVRRRRKAGRDT